MAERWFIPLYHPGSFPRDYGSEAWGAYFTSPHVLDTLLPHVDVWQVWSDQAALNQNNWWTNLMPILRGAGKKIAVAAGNVGNGSVYGWAGSTGHPGVDAWNYDNTFFIAPMVTTSGGIVPDILVLDNAPEQALAAPYSLSQSAAVTETINYLVAAHASYPTMQFGLDVSVPHWTYAGGGDYFGHSPSDSNNVDYAVILPLIVNGAASAGVPLHFLQTDCPYDYANGKHAPAQTGFMSRLIALEAQAHGLGLAFGPMLNSEVAATLSNDLCYREGIAFLDAYRAAGGNPDQIVNIWWWALPDAMLPPETRYTISNLHLALTPTLSIGAPVLPPNYGQGIYGADLYGNDSGPRNYANLAVQTDVTQTRNDVVDGNGTLPSITTETFIADGVTILWPLRYVPSSSWAPPTMTSNNNVRAIGSDYNLTQISPTVSALATGNDGVPPTGTALSITYYYDAPIRLRMQDLSSIADAAALPSLGHVQYRPNGGAVTFASVSADLAGQLTLWAMPTTRVTLMVTQEASTPGFEEGQTVPFTSNRLGISLPMVVAEMHELGGVGTGGGGSKVLNLVLEA